MLFVRIFDWGRRIDSFYIGLAGSCVALFYAAPWTNLADGRLEIFTGMLVYDGFTVYLRAVLLIFVVLFFAFTKLSGLPDREDGADIYTLVLGATLGMCLMASANHLLMIFLAVEMASVPSYALVGMLKGRRQSSEAALKYSIYGAGTAGVMLYGISLIAGLLNSAHLPTLAIQLADKLPAMPAAQVMVLALGGLMLGVGLAFKLAAVPFHFWCPDVFEGATAEVNAFLSVASKAAAIALLVRVAIGFGTIVPDAQTSGPATVAMKSGSASESALFAVDDALAKNPPAVDEKAEKKAEASASDRPATPAAAEPKAAPTRTSRIAALAPVRGFLAKLIAFFAVITCTFGNLAAYGQTNIKRLFAYSTIAHAGYMMMALPAIMAAIGHHADGDLAAKRAVASLGIYIGVYLTMNLGAFAIIAFLRNAMRSEEIADYAGLIRRCPITVICFSIILFSLVGLPPLAGFLGKFAVFAWLLKAYFVTSNAGAPANYLVALLVVGSINTVLSLFYYLRIVKVMTMDPEPANRSPFVHPIGFLQGFYICLITVPTVGWIVCWDLLSAWSDSSASHLL